MRRPKPGGTRAACIVRWVVLAAAVAFIAVGVAAGEHLEVFWKAVTVCLECVGIG